MLARLLNHYITTTPCINLNPHKYRRWSVSFFVFFAAVIFYHVRLDAFKLPTVICLYMFICYAYLSY